MAEEDISLPDQHSFLDLAKSFTWDEVFRLVEQRPTLVNVQPSGRDGTKRWSALHQAAFSGDTTVVQTLLEKGADCEALTNDGRTPKEVAKGSEVKNLLNVQMTKEVIEAKPTTSEDKAETLESSTKTEAKAEKAEPSPKKRKTAAASGSDFGGINLNFFLDKAAETCALKDLVNQPVDTLQGLATLGTAALNHRKVRTIKELANWKFYKIARGIVTLRAAQEKDGRDPSTEMNINKALDKEWETKTLDDIVNAPVSALQGLTPKDDELWAKVHVKTIAQLGTWKFAPWAEAICDLAPFESSDGSH